MLFHCRSSSSSQRRSPNARARKIFYRDRLRFDFPTLIERIGRLGSALLAGNTVAVLDWDSHRYLESYFAIPKRDADLLRTGTGDVDRAAAHGQPVGGGLN
jgi:acyl-CoA synthetase (AMP-forming)/AMP-acid ligase II